MLNADYNFHYCCSGPTGGIEWSISLAPREASNDPVSIVAASRECVISLDNVLFGDVFICSGQSNMVHQLQNVSKIWWNFSKLKLLDFVFTFEVVCSLV